MITIESVVNPIIWRLVKLTGVIIDTPINLSRRFSDVDFFWMAYYSNKSGYICINLTHPIVIEKIDEIVLHELVHWSGSEGHLNRPLTLELSKRAKGRPCNMRFAFDIKARMTEEMTAQLGMYKLSKLLGLDENKARLALEAYAGEYVLADMMQAERESDESVKYLMNMMEQSQVA